MWQPPLLRLRQPIGNFKPWSLRTDIDVFRGLDSWIGIESSKAKAKAFRMRLVALQNWRTAPPAKTSPRPRRRLPFLQQLGSGDKSKRVRRNRSAGDKRTSRCLATLTTVAIAH